MIPLTVFAMAACLGVGASSDRVLAGDLAAAFPEWAKVPPDTPLALAPAPGVQRVFRLPELRRLAQLWNVLPFPEQELCVTRPVQVSTSARLLAAMQKELPTARIEILDFSRQPAPDGELVFPSAGLRQASDGGYWNGYVKYAGNRHFTLWARVRVLVRCSAHHRSRGPETRTPPGCRASSLRNPRRDSGRRIRYHYR